METNKPIMDGTEPEETLTVEQKIYRLEQIVVVQAEQIKNRDDLLERIGNLLHLMSGSLKRHEEILTKAFGGREHVSDGTVN